MQVRESLLPNTAFLEVIRRRRDDLLYDLLEHIALQKNVSFLVLVKSAVHVSM